MEHIGRSSESREGAQVVDLDAVREARSAAQTVLEQHQAGVEHARSLQRGLFDAAHGVACECATENADAPHETQDVRDMWSARMAEQLEAADNRAAA